MANVLLVPYPCQSHINPMLQFAKRLASKGVPAALVVTRFIARTVRFDAGPVRVESISDDHDEGGLPPAASVGEYVERLESSGSASLAALIEEGHFTHVVYDSFMHWVARTAWGMGLPTVPFSTQSCAPSAVYYYINSGLLDAPPPGDNAGVRSEPFAGLPGLERWEFPSFVFHDAPYPALTAPALAQLADRDVGDWVLVNSFDELEYEVLDGLKRHFKVRAIGPCVPLPAADDSGDVDRFTYGANLLDPEDTCIKWLDAKSSRSVVYVSFGSNASIGTAQMEELARGLLAAGKPFLWVVRASEEAQLPRHLLDTAATASGDALVVRWSPQLDVLAHRAVGCFVTHCGWNSTLEALGFGVPMVALPLWTDQPINARLIEEAWGAGVRARRDASAGVFPRGEIEQCVRAVMEDEDGRAASARAAAARRWSEAARAAVVPGGSSDQNLDEFVDYLRASAGEK
ncbi:indole-3-acetate beta-glucosyltransferase-like [Triticum dicoccoides]|uniref:indole-3-acetate beta-glucosyltransferase-like n=1 Tax=Triticum dicoccoides TaxID=85692 RepID=UPI0018907D95|nr:indole-3-acetate beta-glucosyltransferase-like [Triticum dicoccoides]XP_044360432.1 indole-3-acetate beta-glucosyltransferase-like [Triticum aestivum]